MPTQMGSPIVSRISDEVGRFMCCAAARGRRADFRQNRDLRIRRSDRGSDDQSARSHTHPWRLVEWLRSCRRRLHGALWFWYANRRLGAAALIILWHRWLQAELRIINPQGVKPAAQSLDTIGLMVRSVEDAALFLRVLNDDEPVKWLAADVSIRVGLCRTYAWNDAEEATRNAVEDAARRLERAGFSVRDIDLPSPCEELPKTREIINDFERARGMAWEWNTHREKSAVRFQKRLATGSLRLAHSMLRHSNGLRSAASAWRWRSTMLMCC